MALPDAEILAPCPFCGSAAHRIDIEEDGPNFGGSVIACQRCGASSPVHFDRKENLLSSWNERQRSNSMPELDEDLVFILGRPNFVCGPLARAFREDGDYMAHQAEAEQAYVIHKMLGHYFADRATWRENFQHEVSSLFDRLKARAGADAAAESSSAKSPGES